MPSEDSSCWPFPSLTEESLGSRFAQDRSELLARVDIDADRRAALSAEFRSHEGSTIGIKVSNEEGAFTVAGNS